jgi:non-canonical purine NTP pyrophosphatase (RdgB/HAM1 family)
MSLPRRIVFASGNRGKLREVKRLLEGFGVDVVPQSDFDVEAADETGTSFLENSLIKSRHAAQATGLPAIADDSGLAVDALAGAPGVYSARYSGPGASDDSNIDKLLAELDGVPESSCGWPSLNISSLSTSSLSIKTSMGNAGPACSSLIKAISRASFGCGESLTAASSLNSRSRI